MKKCLFLVASIIVSSSCFSSSDDVEHKTVRGFGAQAGLTVEDTSEVACKTYAGPCMALSGKASSKHDLSVIFAPNVGFLPEPKGGDLEVFKVFPIGSLEMLGGEELEEVSDDISTINGLISQHFFSPKMVADRVSNELLLLKSRVDEEFERRKLLSLQNFMNVAAGGNHGQTVGENKKSAACCFM